MIAHSTTVEYLEIPTLNWIGKDKVVNHHLDVPYRTLGAKHRYGNPESAEENKIIHGNNLEALKSLHGRSSEFGGNALPVSGTGAPDRTIMLSVRNDYINLY